MPVSDSVFVEPAPDLEVAAKAQRQALRQILWIARPASIIGQRVRQVLLGERVEVEEEGHVVTECGLRFRTVIVTLDDEVPFGSDICPRGGTWRAIGEFHATGHAIQC